jgi:hypothetical protein
MKRASRNLPVIAFDEAGLGERPSRAVAAGRARLIIRGVYTTDLTTPLKRLGNTSSCLPTSLHSGGLPSH